MLFVRWVAVLYRGVGTTGKGVTSPYVLTGGLVPVILSWHALVD